MKQTFFILCIGIFLMILSACADSLSSPISYIVTATLTSLPIANVTPSLTPAPKATASATTTSTPLPTVTYTPTTVLNFSGEVSRGQIFEKEIAQDLVFRLTPTKYGWNIWMGNKVQPDHDFVGMVTPPFHGMNARYVKGWHFRNSDNSGPNEAGEKNVNAPQKERRFYFVLNEADYQVASIAYDILHYPSLLSKDLSEQSKKQILEQREKLEPREGELAITRIELGNLIVGEQAWIDYMEFEVTLDLPVGFGNK